MHFVSKRTLEIQASYFGSNPDALVEISVLSANALRYKHPTWDDFITVIKNAGAAMESNEDTLDNAVEILSQRVKTTFLHCGEGARVVEQFKLYIPPLPEEKKEGHIESYSPEGKGGGQVKKSEGKGGRHVKKSEGKGGGHVKGKGGERVKSEGPLYITLHAEAVMAIFAKYYMSEGDGDSSLQEVAKVCQ